MTCSAGSESPAGDQVNPAPPSSNPPPPKYIVPGKPWLKPWQKGQSGNPMGRPKEKRLSDWVKEELAKIPPGEKETGMALLAHRVVSEAIAGDHDFAKMVWDKIEPQALIGLFSFGGHGEGVGYGERNGSFAALALAIQTGDDETLGKLMHIELTPLPEPGETIIDAKSTVKEATPEDPPKGS